MLCRVWQRFLIVGSFVLVAAPVWIPFAGDLGLFDIRPLVGVLGLAILAVWLGAALIATAAGWFNR